MIVPGPPLVSVPVPRPDWKVALKQAELLVLVSRKRWVPKRTSNGALVFSLGAQLRM